MTVHTSLKSRESRAKDKPGPGRWLQRRCACGMHTFAGETCDECARESDSAHERAKASINKAIQAAREMKPSPKSR